MQYKFVQTINAHQMVSVVYHMCKNEYNKTRQSYSPAQFRKKQDYRKRFVHSGCASLLYQPGQR